MTQQDRQAENEKRIRAGISGSDTVFLEEQLAAEPRPRQTNCQVEPPYPMHDTVIFALIAPEMTLHRGDEECQIEGPHKINDCGKWAADATVIRRGEE